MTDSVITVDSLSKRFRLYHERNQSLKATILRGGRAKYEEFWALKDVSFEIPRGSTFGLIGENGSGKSTLLKCIAGILQPDKGRVDHRGRMAALLELGSGFHPELSGRENVYLNGSILGLTKAEIDKSFDSIVDFSGIEQFIDQPVKNYSSGMYVRLGFSIAIHVEPEILLVDEILAVGDAAFQKKCMERFSQFREDGRTVVLVSHAMGSLREMCDHVAWLQHGELIDYGQAAGIVDEYLAETTQERLPAPTSDAHLKEYGTGEITITKAELLDRDGTDVSKFHTGDQFRLRIHYRANEPVRNIVFGMAVYTLEGVHLWSHQTSDQNAPIPLIEGEGSIDLTVDRLLLNTGVFDLWLNITNSTDHHEFHMIRGIRRFDVVPGSISEGRGLVVMDGRYDLSRATDAGR